MTASVDVVSRAAGGTGADADLAVLHPEHPADPLLPSAIEESEEELSQRPIGKLMVGAIGVVFGDIGTSPLYSMHEALRGGHGLPVDRANVFGLTSLIFWSLLLVVTAKYVLFVMRAANHGEGGILALLTLARRSGPLAASTVVMLGVAGAALFYGDAIITPAISVLSAVEGLKSVAPGLDVLVVPVALGILIVLFLVQRHGTGAVGALFGPVMTVWFATILVLGLIQIAHYPAILLALDPRHAMRFFMINGFTGFTTLGAVVLAVTGGEALYADMGHFGRRPIRLGWLGFVLPSLVICYLGQAALVLSRPDGVDNPFFGMAPDSLLIPLVLLATMATVIASQAVITGAYSLTRQAVQLGVFPRTHILHTSGDHMGQIYLPTINRLLLGGVVLLVLGFRSSSNLASAYGIAVTGTMALTTLLMLNVAIGLWRWRRLAALAVVAVFLAIDLAFFGANLLKLGDGGWLPLAIGAFMYLIMSTWSRGRELVARYGATEEQPLATFIQDRLGPPRLPGTAIYLTSRKGRVPRALQLDVQHHTYLHERIVILSITTVPEPRVPRSERVRTVEIAPGVLAIDARFGFMQDPSVPRVLRQCEVVGLWLDPAETSYVLGRIIPVPTSRPGMAMWRERLFTLIAQNATSAAEFFDLPPEHTIELGERVAI